MRTEIKKLHQRVGKTTVYVTHDQIEAMTLASRIAVMHQGELQQFDEPRDRLRPAGQHVRRRLHGLAVDEHHAGATGRATATRWPPSSAPASRRQATLPLPPQTAAAARAYVDREVVLGIRPECISDGGKRAADMPGIAASRPRSK